jgi:hypothetical protein
MSGLYGRNMDSEILTLILCQLTVTFLYCMLNHRPFSLYMIYIYLSLNKGIHPAGNLRTKERLNKDKRNNALPNNLPTTHHTDSHTYPTPSIDNNRNNNQVQYSTYKPTRPLKQTAQPPNKQPKTQQQTSTQISTQPHSSPSPSPKHHSSSP